MSAPNLIYVIGIKYPDEKQRQEKAYSFSLQFQVTQFITSRTSRQTLGAVGHITSTGREKQMSA